MCRWVACRAGFPTCARRPPPPRPPGPPTTSTWRSCPPARLLSSPAGVSPAWVSPVWVSPAVLPYPSPVWPPCLSCTAAMRAAPDLALIDCIDLPLGPLVPASRDASGMHPSLSWLSSHPRQGQGQHPLEDLPGQAAGPQTTKGPWLRRRNPIRQPASRAASRPHRPPHPPPSACRTVLPPQ